MNKFKITMSAMLLSSALVGCQNGSQKADEVIIEKPEIEIKDGCNVSFPVAGDYYKVTVSDEMSGEAATY